MHNTVEISFDFVLLDADYEIFVQNGIETPLLRLWGRSNSKRVEVRVSGFLPYFYAEAGEAQIRKILAEERDYIRKWLFLKRLHLCC